MPRNIRNFWIATRADGIANEQETGPRSAEGGFRTDVYLRENAGVGRCVTLTGTTNGDENSLTIDIPAGMDIRAHASVDGRVTLTLTVKR